MRVVASCILFFWCLILPLTGNAAGKDIHILKVSTAIGPGTADYIKSGIDKARKEKAVCLVLVLDTPGGLSESVQDVVINILASRVPVVVYVAPSGARVASTGVLITMAADIAAMAPGTRIGSANPVGISGRWIKGTPSEKSINDMIAQSGSIAEKRGRSTDWVEKAILEGESVNEADALERNIIEIIAADLDALIEKIDGRVIPEKGVLSINGAKKVFFKEGIRTKILKSISDPNIAYVLMMVGLAGLYFELSHPGSIFPGVAGGIAIILAFYSFQNLDVNYTGILLIAVGILFFILEMKTAGFGLLSAAGVASFVLGSLMLFDIDNPEMKILWPVLIPTVTLISVFFVWVARLVFKSRKS